MAPFNTNQVKYIQAVAGRQQHTSLKAINVNGTLESGDFGHNAFTPQTFDLTDPLLYGQFALHDYASAWDARGVHNNDLLEAGDFTDLDFSHRGFGKDMGELRALAVPCVGETGGTSGDGDRVDDAWIASTVRATPDGYLKSLNLKLRLTLPTNIPVAQPTYADLQDILNRSTTGNTISELEWEQFWNGVLANESHRDTIKAALDIYARQHPMHTPHYEFRLIMFRNRLPTYRNNGSRNNLDALRNGVSFLNPGYDLFMGQTGRPRGPLGYRTSVKLDKEMDPSGAPAPYYSGKRWLPTGWVNGTIPKAAGDSGHGNTAGAELYPDGEQLLTHRDLMTMPLNKNDYVVMRDVRFFLGQSQGKSHFEDVFDFDFNDPINTADSDLLSSDTLANESHRDTIKAALNATDSLPFELQRRILREAGLYDMPPRGEWLRPFTDREFYA